MLNLILVAVIFWLYGWHKTLIVYLATIGSVIAVLLPFIVAGGLSFFFSPEDVRTWNPWENNWVQQFTSRSGFTWQQGIWIPFIFYFDQIRAFTVTMIDHTNIFLVGGWLLMWWNLACIWKIAYRFLKVRMVVEKQVPQLKRISY